MRDKQEIRPVDGGSVASCQFSYPFPGIGIASDAQEQRTLFPDMSLADVLFEVGYAFLSLLALFVVNTVFFKFNRPNTRMTWWKVALSFILVWLLSKALGGAFVFLHHHFSIPAIDATVHHYLHPVRDFMMSIVVTGTCYIYYLTAQWQAMLLQNGELQAENVRNQYQALKNQLILTCCSIRSIPCSRWYERGLKRAQDYICQLSHVLRYTLKENDTHVVTLREEMDFVEAYIYLMKMRYEDNLHFIVEVDSRCLDYVLPPLSIQTLVENAVKHNEISSRKPFVIEIGIIRSPADSTFSSLCGECFAAPPHSLFWNGHRISQPCQALRTVIGQRNQDNGGGWPFPRLYSSYETLKNL